MMRVAAAVALLLCAAPVPAPVAAATVGDGALCQRAIAAAERTGRLPPNLLDAIGLVESGRPDPRTGAAASWPWTINVAGVGRFFDTKADAIGAVQAAQLAGIQSIDIGCMQINLLHHPQAFASLDEGFDPVTNVRYAASFLQQLYRQTSSWSAAAVAYHSFTPDRAAEYGDRLALAWPQSAAYGLTLHGAAVVTPRAPLAVVVDPRHVLTSEFRTTLIKAALFRQARDAAMGVRPLVAPAAAPVTPLQHGRTQHAGLGLAASLN